MKREYGIDVLRLLAMFGVVMIHNLLQGGVLEAATGASIVAYWTLEMCGIVAVNVFAMISGYVGGGRVAPFGRTISLYKMVYFYAIALTILFTLLFGKEAWSGIQLWRILLPFLGKDYWYFNAYVVLMLIQPFLAKGIATLSKKQLRQTVGVLLLASGTAGYLDSLFLMSGYSAIWLIIMYLTGAYIQTCAEDFRNIKTYQLWAVISVCVICLVAGCLYFAIYRGHNVSWFTAYVNPIVIIQSVATFIVFQRYKIYNTRIQKCLIKLTPLTFSVYLIDTHPIFFRNILRDSLVWIADYSVTVGFLSVIGISLFMFVAFLTVDAVRLNLFKTIGNLFKEKKSEKVI